MNKVIRNNRKSRSSGDALFGQWVDESSWYHVKQTDSHGIPAVACDLIISDNNSVDTKLYVRGFRRKIVASFCNEATASA